MQYKIRGPKIVMIGAGNVAFHYAGALYAAGFNIVQVYSRTSRSSEQLAGKVDALPITNVQDIDLASDVLIFALNDTILAETIERVNFSGQLALHTSGSIPIEVFHGKAEYYGALYPLQTLTKNRTVNMKEVPLLIEANSSKDLSNLKTLAKAISSRVVIADSLQRRQIHLAAVFASNFVNHMYVVADYLMKKSGFSYQLLKPLILETALKALELNNPLAAQTGPAFRSNKEIIDKHREMLVNDEDLQRIYVLISDHIDQMHHSHPVVGNPT